MQGCWVLLALIGATTAAADVAVFGACYEPTNKNVRCTFGSHWCNTAKAAYTNSYGTKVAAVLAETWKTPSELDTMPGGNGCSCATTEIGGCYWDFDTDIHAITCSVLDGGNPSGAPDGAECDNHASEIGPGWDSNVGSVGPLDKCLCTQGPRPTKKNPGSWTHHGFCALTKDNSSPRCSFSKFDCEKDETFYDNFDAVEDHSIDCFSYQVHTGGCLNNNDNSIMCAVGADSCATSQTWISPRDVSQKYNGKCRGSVAPPAPTAAPTPRSTTPAAGTSNTGLILGIIALVIAIMTAVFVIWHKLYRENSNAGESGVPAQGTVVQAVELQESQVKK
jgi:hypothetical protein